MIKRLIIALCSVLLLCSPCSAWDVSSVTEGYWKLNENAATATVADTQATYSGTAKNSSGNINTDTIDATGKLNGAFTFDGATNSVYVDMGDSLDKAYNAAFSVAAWIKTGTEAEQTIIGKIDVDNSGRGWLFELDGTGLVFFYCDNEANYDYFYLESSGTTNNAWHFVAFSYTGTPGNANSVEFYVDGTHYDANVASSGTVDSSYAGAQPLTIGLRKGSSNTLANQWTGLIDNVQVFSRVITQDEVTGLYNSGSGTESLTNEAPASRRVMLVQ